MARLIEEFFGKKAPITKQDLEKFLRNFEELVRLEFKEIRVQYKESIKEQILKSIVGFLNSAEGEGLLIVGVSDNKEIRGIIKAHLDKEKIRNWIRDGVGSVPRAIAPPEYDIMEVDVGEDKYVYLIEVHKKDDVVYFSRDSGCAYVRIGDSTNRLNLSESLELVAKKSLAKPYVIFEVIDIKQVSQDEIELTLKPIVRNIGSKPAFYMTAVIEVTGKGILNSWTVDQIIKVEDHIFQFTAGFAPLTIPAYPTNELNIRGVIVLKLNPLLSSKLEIRVTCYEMEVMSRANYEVELRPSMSGEIIEPTKKEFRPYITLSSLR